MARRRTKFSPVVERRRKRVLETLGVLIVVAIALFFCVLAFTK